MNIFLGFVDIFFLGGGGVITKLDWSFLCILGSLLEVNVQNGDIFWVAKFTNIFLGMPDIPDLFW